MSDEDNIKIREYGTEYARQLERERDPNGGHTTRCYHGNVICAWCEKLRREQ